MVTTWKAEAMCVTHTVGGDLYFYFKYINVRQVNSSERLMHRCEGEGEGASGPALALRVYVC